MWIIPMCKWILTKSPRIPPRSRPDWRVSWSKRCRVRCRATHLYVRRECTQWCMVIYLIIYYEMKLLPNPRSARMNAAFGKTNIQISYTFLNKELQLFYVIYKTCGQKKKRKECVITQSSICGIDQPISIAIEKSVLQENRPFRSFLSW